MIIPWELVVFFLYGMCLFTAGFGLGLRKGKDEGRIESLKQTNQELKSLLENLESTTGDRSDSA